MDDGGPQPTTDGSATSRRGFLERLGVTAGTLVTLGAGGSKVAPRFSPVGRAQAIHPAVAVGAAYVTYRATKWVVDEITADEASSAPEGYTASALHDEVYNTMQSRESYNASTFVDNRNLMDQMDHAAYGDGKIAGIEALNDQLTSSEVQNAATDAGAEYVSTIMKNFLKSWNEAAREVNSRVLSVAEHADLAMDDVFGHLSANYADNSDPPETWFQLITEPYELPNGESFDIKSIRLDDMNANGSSYREISRYDPTETYENGDNPNHVRVYNPDGSGDYFTLLGKGRWQGIFTDMETIWMNVSDGLVTWTDKVYNEVQSGEIETSELLTPRELAEMTADEENVNQALADLMALNIPVDLEREATITLEQDNGTITLKGVLAPTSPPDGGLPAGQSYDPSTMDSDIYFNYDITQGSGEWLAYEEGVDGGVVTFTSEPHAETNFTITTTAGEQVTVAGSEFTVDDSGSSSVWTVDLSDKLDNAITSIESVEMAANASEPQFELVQLTDPFTIETYTDSDGNEYDNASFSQSEPQNDTNYITQEEWQDLVARQETLIEKYEESKEEDDSWTWPNPFGGSSGGGLLGMGIIAVVILGVVGAVTDLLPGTGN
uniref:Envelope protein N-terminal domain-containing protein n=1 Tax=Haloterrigena alkaliphila TaxID=2816475 RepID=A0A8A2VK87_9EURY